MNIPMALKTKDLQLDSSELATRGSMIYSSGGGREQKSTAATTSNTNKKKEKYDDRNDPQLVINCTYSRYEVIEDVAEELNMKTTEDEELDWDVWFIDGPIIPSLLNKMKSYQRVNHFAGMYALARKNLLAKNLLAMRQWYPHEFSFFPQTWMLPADLKSFKEQFNSRKAKTFIIKPEASSQGQGIFLTRGCDWLKTGEHYVA